MTGPFQERALINDLDNPILITGLASSGKAGSTAASALSFLAQQWQAEPVVEFTADTLYDYNRLRPQLETRDGETSLRWPNVTVYKARPEGANRTVLLLVGVEPTSGWQGLIEAITGFCRRAGVTTAITLHCSPASVSHRGSTPVVAVYGSENMQSAIGLPATVFPEGPMSLAAVLSLHLNAAGVQTADLFAMEPFYTPGLPDAQAALALINVIDRYLACQTDVRSLVETAGSQRELYEQAVRGSEALSQLAEQLDRQHPGTVLLQSHGEGPGEEGGESRLSVEEVMSEAFAILNLKR